MKWMQRNIGALLVAGALSIGLAGPAAAQQDGLVNVQIGDVTILEDVSVALAARVVANVCALVEADVLVLAQQVDQGLGDFTCNQRGSGRTVAIANN